MPEREREREEGKTSEMNEEERDRGTENDAFIGDEEQRKTEQRKKLEPNPATLDHSVASYDPQESYGEPIFNLSQAYTE